MRSFIFWNDLIQAVLFFHIHPFFCLEMTQHQFLFSVNFIILFKHARKTIFSPYIKNNWGFKLRCRLYNLCVFDTLNKVKSGVSILVGCRFKEEVLFSCIVKLQSSPTIQSKSVGLGVDFVFPLSQQQGQQEEQQ